MFDVHVVVQNEDHIVPRMGRWLAEACGWTLSTRPRANARLNYYMPYTAYNKMFAPKGKTAAWFTHLETGNRGKLRLWNDAADALDLRIVTSPIYEMAFDKAGANMTRRVVPGIDTELFRPVSGADRVALLGVGGLGSDRKGTALARNLAETGYSIAASGIGWNGVPCRWYADEQMPAFYNGLGVFVCTSTIEGIPAPPLEALACGIRVVVPRHVGIMDELPERPGIRHYESGNYDQLRGAIRLVIYDKKETRPQQLREVVTSKYTVKAWVKSHKAAFEELLS